MNVTQSFQLCRVAQRHSITLQKQVYWCQYENLVKDNASMFYAFSRQVRTLGGRLSFLLNKMQSDEESRVILKEEAKKTEAQVIFTGQLEVDPSFFDWVFDMP